MLLLRFSTSLVVATGICSQGLRKRSLSASGAAAAFCMGVLHMTCSWTFGLVLICFFATSSKLTKFRQEQKAKLDAHIKPGGQRNAVQVLCNSMVGGLAALIASAASAASKNSQSDTQRQTLLTVQLAAWCAFLGHYACCCADTWASELGMLSSSQPRLITNLQRKVPAGVNGGVTGLGLAASAAGGLCVGATLAAIGMLTGEAQAVQAVINQHLWPAPLQLLPATARQALFWLVLSLFCGVVGSVVDSVLGATLQYSGYDPASGKVTAQPGPQVKHISGQPWLSNDAVNASSALLISLLAAATGVYVSAARS